MHVCNRCVENILKGIPGLGGNTLLPRCTSGTAGLCMSVIDVLKIYSKVHRPLGVHSLLLLLLLLSSSSASSSSSSSSSSFCFCCFSSSSSCCCCFAFFILSFLLSWLELLTFKAVLGRTSGLYRDRAFAVRLAFVRNVA
jgi:hypothetical protein